MIKWLPIAVLAALVAMTAGCDAPSTSQTAGSSQSSAPADSSSPSGSASSSTGAPSSPAKVAEADYKTLDGGLKYATLAPGSGPEAKDGQRITMQYTGWLKDGKKFDSSFDHPGSPFQFTLGAHEVIKGWDLGVKGMKTGEKRQLVIPSELGYGANGTPDGTIPPGATLIFDVQLVKAE